MRFVPLELEGAFLVEPERHEDERGFFARTWDGDEFAAHGLAAGVVQSQHLAQYVRRHVAGPAFPVGPA